MSIGAKYPVRGIVLAAALTAVHMQCATAFAQKSRVRIQGATIRSPGRFTTSVTTFNSYSYGTGNVGRGAQSSYGGPLRSSLSTNPLRTSMNPTRASASIRSDVSSGNPLQRPVNFNKTRSTAPNNTLAPVRMETLGPNRSKGGGKRYQDVAAGNADLNRLAGARPELPQRPDIRSMTATNTAADYLHALQAVSGKNLKEEDPDKPVTSLAPEEPGALRDLLLEGERHFRLKKYRQALNRFKMAEDMSMGSPESMLSLMHTYFAASYDSYSLPAYYLRKTLKVFPELALTPIHPKNFYGDTAVYIDDLLRLKKHVRERPDDHDAQFVLAYLEWRDDNPQESRSLLSAALGKSDNDKLSEAIRILWDGMAASGKVSGELKPATRPAGKS